MATYDPTGHRVPILVDRGTYNEYKEYSEQTGVPVARVVREALENFSPTLKTRVTALTTRRK